MIRPVRSDAELELCARINNVVNPDSPVSAEQLRERPTGELLLHASELGYAFVDRSVVVGSAFTMLRVAPEARRQGIGSTLLSAALDRVRALALGSAWGMVAAIDDESLGFTARRGFVAVGRDVDMIRTLGDTEGEIPAGIVELRDEHRRGAYAVAVECIPDMALGEDSVAAPFDDWANDELSGPAQFVALDGGQVVGYASLHALPATPDRLEHGLTGVLRSHRRRGIATALKRSQIAWAAEHGYRELVTDTEEANVAMRAVNRKLGYVERPGAIRVQGPVD